MALTGGFQIQGADIPAIANGALTKYTVVKLSTDSAGGHRRVATCDTTDIPFGVVQDTAATGEICTIRTEGITLISANGAFAISDELCVAAADGQVDTLSADGWSIGQALHAAGNANEEIPVKLNIHYHNVP
jgi:predicted RecA/RadA family phage recombinase